MSDAFTSSASTACLVAKKILLRSQNNLGVASYRWPTPTPSWFVGVLLQSRHWDVRVYTASGAYM